MNPDLVPVKTERAREMLRAGAFPGSRAQRALLIMVDGRLPVSGLLPAMKTLGLTEADLAQLEQSGLIEWQRRPAAHRRGAPRRNPDFPTRPGDLPSSGFSTLPADLIEPSRPTPFDDLDIEL